jgi:hypothetical protein
VFNSILNSIALRVFRAFRGSHFGIRVHSFRWDHLNPITGDDCDVMEPAASSVETMTPDDHHWRGWQLD